MTGDQQAGRRAAGRGGEGGGETQRAIVSTFGDGVGGLDGGEQGLRVGYVAQQLHLSLHVIIALFACTGIVEPVTVAL